MEDLPTPGKANAWNEFVHRLSPPGAGLLVLMDADIGLGSADTISRLVGALDASPSAVVSVGKPVPIVPGGPNGGVVSRVLARSARAIDPADVPLAGALYCARASDLRTFRIPTEIQVEDGFVRAMLLTRCFTQPEDRSRIVLAEGASHTFEVVGGLGALFRHERWIAAGSIVNMLLFRRFGGEARPGRSASDLMREWSNSDDRWLPRMVQAEARSRGLGLLPGHWWTRRFTRLRAEPWSRKLGKLPTATAAAVLDAAVFLSAIRDVRNGGGYRYWGRR